MLQLYGNSRSRAMRCLWMLEEMGEPYQLIEKSTRSDDLQSAEYLRLNPNARIPTLVDGDLVLWESMAINLYPAQKYEGPMHFAGPEVLGLAAQWSFWAMLETGPFRRDKFDIKTHTTPALEIGLDNLRILRATGDLQAAGMHPIQRLAGLLGKRFDLTARVLDEADHQVAFSSATHHAGRAGRGLRSNVMLVDEGDAEPLALAQIIGCRSAKPAGTNDDNIRLIDHACVPEHRGEA